MVMEILALALAAVLALGCVLFVARPFLREPEAVDDRIRVAGTGEQERIRLEEERDRALAALKELEFDHRTGKISDADYRESVGPLRSQVAQLLRALDAQGRASDEPTKAGEVTARA
jgi:hypothetical protein